MDITKMTETEAREAVHNAVMNGLKAAHIPYDSDGNTYWVDFKGGTLYIGIDKCEN